MVWSKSVNHKKVGDALRDAGQWKKAEEAYRRHLKTDPNDAGIWVQYGHVLREQGKLDQAEIAYESSTSIAPHEPDGWLQLGYTLKDSGKLAAALEALRQADLNGAHDQLEGLIADLSRTLKLKARPTTSTCRYLFSVQDVFAYLKAHSTLSGMQRVQAGLVLQFLRNASLDCGYVITDASSVLERGTLWQLSPEHLRSLLEYSLGDRVEPVRLRRLLAIAEQNAHPITAGPGTTVALLGAFWGHGNSVEHFLPAKRAGARIALFVYDLIPVSHPEYCDPALVREFTAALHEWCLVCDYILTISEFTRVSVERFLSEQDLQQMPVASVPLAHTLPGPANLGKIWPKSLLALKDREYVAYVSTIEGRKNHSYVVHAWRQLMAQGIDVPDLVFVGRMGWRVNGLIELLDGTNNLGGRVHVVHDLTDAELSAVYENSLFTVFTSMIEGWGLPVGESLRHGTPCVASSTSAIPEVGDDFVDYIDPLSVTDGVAVFERLLTDRSYLAERRRNIVENFNARDWDEVAATFLGHLQKMEQLPPREPDVPPLPEGHLFRPGDIANPDGLLGDHIALPNRLLVAEHFQRPEAFGAWMTGPIGEIRFKTDLAEGEAVNLYLKLRSGPALGTSAIKLSLGGRHPTNARPLGDQDLQRSSLVKVQGDAGPGGVCRLVLEIEGTEDAPSGDAVAFCIGLEALGYARPSNLTARTDILEAFSFIAGTWGNQGPAKSTATSSE